MAPRNQFKLKKKNAVRTAADVSAVNKKVEINILTLYIALKYIGQMFRLNFRVLFSDNNK